MNGNLLSMHDLSPEDVTRILDTADSLREVGSRVIKKVPAVNRCSRGPKRRSMS